MSLFSLAHQNKYFITRPKTKTIKISPGQIAGLFFWVYNAVGTLTFTAKRKNKTMKEEQDLVSPKQSERLIVTSDSNMVAIDFRHLDNLIGSLCHVLDLNSDKEYREHVKSEIKMRCRQWLQDQYDIAGYEEFKQARKINGNRLPNEN